MRPGPLVLASLRDDFVKKGLLEKIGTTDQGTHYILNCKGLSKGLKDSSTTHVVSFLRE